jgi:TonB-linked SusC/RagA family outer membrane protein
MDPLTPVTYTGALPGIVQNAIAAGMPLVKDDNGNYFGLSQYVLGEYANPLARIHSTHGSTVQNKVVGNIYADIEPVKGLKFTTRFGIDAAFQREHGWTPTYWYSSEKLNTVAGGYDWGNNWFNWQWENFANYQRKIGNHNFTVLAGTSAVKRMWNYLGGTFSGLFKEEDRFSYADFVPNTQDRIASNATVSTLSSYYGRLSYDFKSKYLLNATVRRDGSSLLSTNNQWRTYPSMSLGWVLSNESFYPSGLSDIMNSFKARASWGQNGSIANVLIGQWQAAITTQNIRYPDANNNYLIGAAPSNLENSNLKWETSEQIDFGADISFLRSRLLFSVDYYKKTTKDLLTPGTAPLFAGNILTVVNGGNVENKGWELDLSYRDKTSGDFRYEIAGNLSTLHNKVTYLDPNVSEILGAGIGTGWNATAFKLGNPIWYFRGYKTAGIFQTQDEVTKYLNTTGITGYNPKPGEPVVVDVNGDKQISVADQTYIGSPHPKFIYGGRVNLAYKGFDFIAFIQGQSGNDILMGFNRIDRPTANKPAFFYNNRWTGAGSTNTWFAPNTSNAYIYNSDLMIFNGSYARVRQLQLGYTLPAPLAGRLKTKTARVYVSLDDFFTFTNYPGLDPEAGSSNANSLGIDRGVYPVPRKVLAGLSITF